MKIAVEDLRVRLGGRDILHGVGFAAEPGTVTALVGPNGSGKTTLLRALSGMLPHRGRVRFGTRATAPREAIGYMAQDTAGRAVLTVFEVVLLGRLSRLGVKVSEGDLAAASRALDVVGVAHLAEAHIGELSGGQRQLVHFAQVLAREPKVILLDEPTSALDLRNQLHLLDLVRRETRARGLTTIVTLHDLNAAARFADRLVVLHDGRLARCGVPETVIDDDLLAEVWGVAARVTLDDQALPTVIPLGALAAGSSRPAAPAPGGLA